MILNSGEEERRNDELAKATNELASEEFLRSKNPTRTGKYIYKNAAFKDKKHFTLYELRKSVLIYLCIKTGFSAQKSSNNKWMIFQISRCGSVYRIRIKKVPNKATCFHVRR